ncbi:MAG: amylo-alpha-1,6-glucosidase [Cyanobacteriota bacterium]
MTTETLELDGKMFVPAEELPFPEWPSVLADRPLPTLTLKDDDLFLVTDTLGNIGGSLRDDLTASMGLFCHDTRFLSRLELQIEGRSPVLLHSTADKGFALSVLCTNPRLDDSGRLDLPKDSESEDQSEEGKPVFAPLKAESISISREIVLNGALFEEIHVRNYSTDPVRFQLSLSLDADFVDLFEVRGYGRDRRGQLLRMLPKSEPTQEPIEELTLAYKGLDGSLMQSRIQFVDRQPDDLKGYTAIWHLEMEPHETQKLGYRLQMLTNNRPISRVNAPATLGQAKAAESSEQNEWRQHVTQIRSDKTIFNRTIERAEQDIYLLRQTFGKGKALSAGVPWFSTLFGRDSIIAASQTLILDPTIARETLTILAQYQGTKDDDWRDEQPGKILHEIRMGEMARCEEIPHTPYYGTIDATPLWLMLYAEYYAWTHDTETLERLWPNAMAAMDWIDRQLEKTGYVSYYRLSKRGLANQGWKDSGDCIVNRKGELAKGAIALCEVQAYVYAAKVRLAEIARLKKRLDLADLWQEQAKDLKRRFNQDFWMDDEDFCALALDGEGKQVNSITSNPGHCLSLGILSPEKAYSVAERLRAPDMFSGWGIRTLSSVSPAYNPMGYHVGSVWPHDNAIIASGLRSLGLVDQTLELCQALADMMLYQPYERPPELFCGYERVEDKAPVNYPVACSPQAWGTGSVFQLLQAMVNLVPDARNNCLRIIDPALPESINSLSLHNLRVGSTLLDLEFERSGSTTACRVAKKRGNLRVVIEA